MKILRISQRVMDVAKRTRLRESKAIFTATQRSNLNTLRSHVNGVATTRLTPQSTYLSNNWNNTYNEYCLLEMFSTPINFLFLYKMLYFPEGRPAKMKPSSNIIIIIFCIAFGITVLFLTWFLVGSSDSERTTSEKIPPSADRQNSAEYPTSVSDDEDKKGLMEYSKSPLALAIINLRSARGLPGSENLDIEKCIVTLNEWAAHIKKVTDSQMHQFREHPERFDNSEAYFRMLALKTVLFQDLKVHYNPELIANPKDTDLTDFSYAKDSKDMFLHGLLTGKKVGTCASLPVLVTVLGRMLGYPLKLVPAKTHLFVRWEDGREKLNVEATVPGLAVHSDEYYRHWPYEITGEEMAQGYYLKSLSTEQEIVVCMSNLYLCLMANDMYLDAMIQFKQIEKLAPNYPHIGDLIKSLQKFLDNEMKTPYAKNQLATRQVLSRLDRQEFREKVTIGCEFEKLEQGYPEIHESKKFNAQKAAILNGISLKYSRRKNEASTINDLRNEFGLEPLGTSDSKIIAVAAMERENKERQKALEDPQIMIENVDWQDILDKMKSEVVIAGTLEVIMLHKEADSIIEEYKGKSRVDESPDKSISFLSDKLDAFITKSVEEIFPQPPVAGKIQMPNDGPIKEAKGK